MEFWPMELMAGEEDGIRPSPSGDWCGRRALQTVARIDVSHVCRCCQQAEYKIGFGGFRFRTILLGDPLADELTKERKCQARLRRREFP